jgi:uncharacterized iron-regulated protein
MHTFTSLLRTALILSAPFLLTLVVAWQSTAAPAEGKPAVPEQSISISFDMEHSSLTGTSRIILPPGTPILLNCGPLEVTGAVLEIEGLSQYLLLPDGDNMIRLPASDRAQTVFVSWRLTPGNPYAEGNLISGEGITLAGFWHPIPSIDMHYRLEAELPGDFTGISEGETVTYCEDKGGDRFLNTVFLHPIRTIHFAAGPYTVKHRKLGNGVELAAFFFAEDIDLADGYLDKAAGYIKRYENLVGPFPYSRYSIVENRLPTGYGMPTFTLLGQAVVRLPFIKDTSLGHEILHSWFGNSVFQSYDGGNWTEGLTTYLADHLYAEDEGEGGEYRKNQLLRYLSYVHEGNEMTLRDFADASDSQPMARKVRAIGYDKASMLFHMLRVHLGDETFFNGISAFYREMKFRRAGWEDIKNIFAETSGEELDGFFDQWLTRADIPRFTFSDLSVDQVDGRSTITFKVTQKTGEPYSLLLPMVVETLTTSVREVLEVRTAETTAEITVDELPVRMFIDPGYDMMRDLAGNEIPPIWSLFLGAENKTAVLASPGESEVYEPLVGYLEALGCEIVSADDLDNSDLKEGSFIFLDSSRHSRGLFADPEYPGMGFTLDVRDNPLNTTQVMVLVKSSSREETAAVIRKLPHYGKYSYLHFLAGDRQTGRIADSENGIPVNLFVEPKGIAVPAIKSFDEIVRAVRDDKVIYVGEVHTDMGSHILQLQVIQALYNLNRDLAIGMEMFPRSSQEALDGYISGAIATEREFLKKSNYFDVWGFDYRLYRDIINFARSNSIPLVALNIDKAIVSQVFREGGLDSLEEEQLDKIPGERDLDVPGYSERLSRAFALHGTNADNGKMGAFIQAQSIWDEAMAESIATYLRQHPDKQMVVIAGNGHVFKDSAIPLRVERRMEVPQSVLVSINHEATGQQTGYQVDYLVYTSTYELEPSPKMGVVLQKENIGETEETRVRITQISPHGKAGESGLKVDDVILEADGVRIEDITDLKATLLDKSPGDTVNLKVLRRSVLFGEREMDIDVELTSPMDMQGGMPPSHPR